jgi:nicotinamide riboside kinase
MQQQIKKIVIIGPESTGKSTLSELLAKHYNTEWCEEYAREYLLTNGTNYSFDDLLTIAKGQVELEDKHTLSTVNRLPSTEGGTQSTGYGQRLTDGGRLLFIDTDMYVMKVWCEYVFGKCHPYIEEQIAQRKYDLYLLCNIDLPWVKDELREYPDEAPRKELYAIYKNILESQSVPWVDISGNYEERLQKAIEAVDRIL